MYLYIHIHSKAYILFLPPVFFIQPTTLLLLILLFLPSKAQIMYLYSSDWLPGIREKASLLQSPLLSMHSLLKTTQDKQEFELSGTAPEHSMRTPELQNADRP